ncbi:serine hydrolase domain-containing protein [Phenylobacterium sp.]|uniref:serine hydrolase domain-containing protein n=1 Tax=Phenylobacterium sp. TaxID=1871053 RepID=UPI002FCA152D
MSMADDEVAQGAKPDNRKMAAGFAAKLACSGVFVSGRTLEDVVRDDIQRASPLTRDIEYALDVDRQTVTATKRGVSVTALHRPGVGAVLVVDADLETLRRQTGGMSPARTLTRPGRWPEGEEAEPATRDVPGSALSGALDAIFADETPDREMDTRALVVVHGGLLVAERYAPGYGPATRLLGWSASKSVLATLVGILVDEGRLRLDAPAPVSEWRTPGDPRGAITLRHLLHMSSGLAFSEPYVPGADSTVMLFERGDMAGFAAASPLAHPPGEVWDYSSGTTNLLSRIVMEAVGGSMAAYQNYARERLFEPAGMASAVFEPDERGVIVGSSYLYATARDWARFGQLYMNGGELNGRRILSKAWVDFVQRPAPAAPLREYAAHFRLNPLQEPGGTEREYPNLPHDMYLARGHNRQIVAIMPTQRTVIVRLGWTVNDRVFELDRHFSAILAALRL